MTAPGQHERYETQRILDRDQALLDLDQAAFDRARLRLDYQQAEADIGEARTAREHQRAPLASEALFDLETASRTRGQGAQDAQDTDLDDSQGSIHRRQIEQDQVQRAHDEAASAGQAELERSAREQRERARMTRAEALCVLELARQARDEARRLRDDAAPPG